MLVAGMQTGVPEGDGTPAEVARCYQGSLRGIMQARSSTAGQAIGKQFKNITSGMFSTC